MKKLVLTTSIIAIALNFMACGGYKTFNYSDEKVDSYLENYKPNDELLIEDEYTADSGYGLKIIWGEGSYEVQETEIEIVSGAGRVLFKLFFNDSKELVSIGVNDTHIERVSNTNNFLTEMSGSDAHINVSSDFGNEFKSFNSNSEEFEKAIRVILGWYSLDK